MNYLDKNLQEKLQENGFVNIKFVESVCEKKPLRKEKIYEFTSCINYAKVFVEVYATKEYSDDEEVEVGDIVFISTTITHITETLCDCEYEELEVPKIIESYYELRVDNSFDYMMLSRLVRDCEYFLGNGNGYLGHLYYETVEEHISKMMELWNGFLDDEKPEWLSLEEIKEYKEKMILIAHN